MNEKEKKAIEIVKKIKNMKFNVTSSFYSSGTISLSIEEKEAIETVLNLITKLKKENKEKDKQIDLMAKTINNAYFSENDFWSWFEKVFGIKPDGDYKKDIKQYFERKATNDD